MDHRCRGLGICICRDPVTPSPCLVAPLQKSGAQRLRFHFGILVFCFPPACATWPELSPMASPLAVCRIDRHAPTTLPVWGPPRAPLARCAQEQASRGARSPLITHWHRARVFSHIVCGLGRVFSFFQTQTNDAPSPCFGGLAPRCVSHRHTPATLPPCSDGLAPRCGSHRLTHTHTPTMLPPDSVCYAQTPGTDAPSCSSRLAPGGV